MEILKQTAKAQSYRNRLYEIFPQVFWDVEVKKLDIEKHYRLIITQIINYGSATNIRCLFQVYEEEAIKEVLIHPIRGVWFPRTYKAFCNLFDIPYDEKAFNILHLRRQAYHGVRNIWA